MPTVQEQIDYELKAHEEWANGWHSTMQGNVDAGLVKSVPFLHRVMLNSLPKVTEALQKVVEDKTRGPGGAYRHYIKEVTPEVAANLTITLSVAGGATGQNMLSLLKSLGTAVVTELNFRRAELVNPIYMRELHGSLEESRSRNVQYIHRTVRAAVRACEVEPLHLDIGTLAGIGKLLFEPVYNLGIFEVRSNFSKGRQDSSTVHLHESLLEGVGVIPSSRLGGCKPPLLIPPNAIEEDGKGGMWHSNGLAQQYRLISAPKRSARLYDSLHKNLKMVSAGVTALSSTPLRVNTAVMNLLSRVITGGGFGLPEEPREPVCPYDIPAGMTFNEFLELYPEAARPAMQEELDFYRLVKRSHKTRLRKYKATTVEIYSNLRLGRSLLKTNRFYLPTFSDSRGRLYYGGGFNPQGVDAQKALLEFADGVPLGDTGMYWLKVHIANCFGYDKKHFDLRVAYVDAMLHRIREAVSLPEVHVEFWETADCPFSAWAACLELVQALNMPDPRKYESRVITAWDATCSGLQHFSALLRDPLGAAATNLCGGGEEKADIYGMVSGIVLGKVQQDFDKRDPDTLLQAQFWVQHGIPRDLAKKPVMTFVYGLTRYACTDWVSFWLYENKVEPPAGVSRFLLASYLANILYDSIPDVVPAAAVCMQWLHELSKKVARDGEYMHWVTPTNFDVYNLYQKEQAQQVRIRAFGLQALRCYKQLDIPDAVRCGNGFAPNFVHSLDAAHLTLTVLEAKRLGMDSVTVHDSFGCHAGNAGEYHKVLRRTFREMYEQHSPLEELAERYGADAPARGTFDMRELDSAVYPFC